jgi:putative exosortase-associated protein (TIGR04073 family)
MKKILSSFAILLTTFVMVQADIVYPDGTKPMPAPYALKKFSRGLANILTFPIELPKAAWDAQAKYGITDFRQITDMLSVGSYKALRRAGAGVYDFATFLDEDKLPKYNIDPEFLNAGDIFPAYNYQFDWETIDTPASRVQY